MSASDETPRAVRDLPVVHVGEVPTFDPETWQLAIEGEVRHRRLLGWRGFLSLPTAELVSDLACSLGWMRAACHWRGIRLAQVIGLAEPTERARFARLADHQGYDAVVPLGAALEAGALLAWELDGQPLRAAHGGPLRAVVPGGAATVCVKWVRRIELLAEPEPGYWDRRGVGAPPAV